MSAPTPPHGTAGWIGTPRTVTTPHPKRKRILLGGTPGDTGCTPATTLQIGILDLTKWGSGGIRDPGSVLSGPPPWPGACRSQHGLVPRVSVSQAGSRAVQTSCFPRQRSLTDPGSRGQGWGTLAPSFPHGRHLWSCPPVPNPQHRTPTLRSLWSAVASRQLLWYQGHMEEVGVGFGGTASPSTEHRDPWRGAREGREQVGCGGAFLLEGKKRNSGMGTPHRAWT